MSELQAQIVEWRTAIARVLPWGGGPRFSRALAIAVIVIGIVLPFFFSTTSGFMNATIIAVAFAVMSLGLNIVVGFAGLLDLGYVAFYALGAYSVGWFGSDFFFQAHVHVGVSGIAATSSGIHLNFLLILVAAALICGIAGMIIGLPTLRLRGDYIAVVTLAFGEIIRVLAVNGQSVSIGNGMTLTAGNLGISAVDTPYFPGVGQFNLLDLRPWYWLILGILLVVLFVNLRLRDSRMGRAWVALREDEVAAVSMGIPLVRTKLAAYAIGAMFGGMSGAFLGAYYTTINAGQFQFGFSIFILAMVIIGGLGSIWGAVVGGMLLGYINNYLI
ncbi:MAG: branched-chain amino acid ABC transporter permease, partial [Candidatus Dormibacteraeota bacterium]|nr:branched-chain amino acid ABC transporter permease [Candidatus Dormibacteraeota bacterium]